MNLGYEPRHLSTNHGSFFRSNYYFLLLRQKKENNMPNLQEVEHFGAMIRHTPTRFFFLRRLGWGCRAGLGKFWDGCEWVGVFVFQQICEVNVEDFWWKFPMEVGGNLVKVSLDSKPTTTQSQDFVTSDLVEVGFLFRTFWLQKKPQTSGFSSKNILTSFDSLQVLSQAPNTNLKAWSSCSTVWC